MKKSRAERARALEEWADGVEGDALVVADTEVLRTIGELADRRERVESALVEAVRTARRADRSWSEIGAMLGVSKQAAQRKYSKLAS
jgi:hypothetical protein